MIWRLRYWLAESFERWAERLRPRIPEPPRECIVKMAWPEMPSAPPLSEILTKLTKDAV